ncbi:hypothetical protein PRUPE_5G049700 [Prunus persica]|uniref:Protein phosphatase n=2 Tax=Prunus persica TaxID=3760 RepID=A0A251P7C6_PRUPE|nr:hypothetical protein PRUPE_5G049700 [Prunus persica]
MIAANKPPAFGLGPIHNCYGCCGYGRGPYHKKKLNSRTDQLHLICGSCYLPKENKEKPLGEDAHFICHDAQTIGVADGVGGWARKGVDAGEYARGLMNHAKKTATGITRSSAAAVDPRKVLSEAYANNAGVQGSSTACILSLDKERGTLHAVNVGDSGFMVFRDNMCFFKSSTQQRSFNCPYQLGNCVGGDCPEAAEEFEVEELRPGDIIVLGTDGLLDNIFASEIEEVIVAYDVSGQDCEELASYIANRALYNSLDKYNVSPFQMEAQKAGREHVGGKIDDITVVVARVLASTKNKNKNIYKKLSIERNTGTTTRAYSLKFQFHIGERHKAFDVPCQNAFLRYTFSCFRNSANLAKRFLECAT